MTPSLRVSKAEGSQRWPHSPCRLGAAQAEGTNKGLDKAVFSVVQKLCNACALRAQALPYGCKHTNYTQRYCGSM